MRIALLAALSLSVGAQKDPPPAPVIGHDTYLHMNHVTTVSVRGDVMLLGGDYGGLNLFDLSDRSILPPAMGRIDTPRNVAFGWTGAKDFAVVGYPDHAGLDIIDFRGVDYTTQHPELRGSYTASGATIVHVVGQYVYVVDGEGLLILDISDPTSPVLLSTFVGGLRKEMGIAGAILVDAAGAYLYARTSEGVDVFDVSDKTPGGSIVHVANVFQRGAQEANDFALSSAGTHLFVTLSNGQRAGGEMLSIDVRDPANPVATGSILAEEGEMLLAIAVMGDRAFIGAWQGLLMVDVSVPTAPVRVGVQPVHRADGVSVVDGYVYVKEWTGIHIIDATQYMPAPTPVPAPLVPISAGTPGPTTARPTGTLGVATVPQTYPQHEPRIALAGSGADLTALVSRSSQGTAAFNIDAGVPQYREEMFFPEKTYRPVVIAMVGESHALIAGDYSGFYVYAVGGRALTYETRLLAPPRNYVGVHIEGNRAYMMSYHAWIDVVDVSSPATPVTIGSLYMPGAPLVTDFAGFGNFAYVSTRFSDPTLYVVDMTDSTAPVQVGSVNGLTAVEHRIAAGPGVVLMMYNNKVVVIDVADPTAPFIAATMEESFAKFQGAVFVGSTAYITDRYSRLHVVDVSNPAAPVTVQVITTQVAARDITMQGDVAYITDGNSVESINTDIPPTPAARETSALLNLKGLSGAGKLASWTGGEANVCSTWSGITCNPEGRVTRIELENEAVQGAPDLSALESLELLMLQGTEITGLGPLPASLIGLDVSYTQINGPIPAAILDAANLEVMKVNGAGLTGSVPRLPANVRRVELQDNGLEGSIPVFPASLTQFVADRNGFTGTLSAHSGVVRVTVNHNALEGSIPAYPSLIVGHFHKNDFSGAFNAHNTPLAEVLNLSHNRFSGPLPDLVSTRLQAFSCYVNGFTGSFPSSSTWNRAPMQKLEVNYNQLSGAEPTMDEALLVASIVRFHGNNFN